MRETLIWFTCTVYLVKSGKDTLCILFDRRKAIILSEQFFPRIAEAMPCGFTDENIITGQVHLVVGVLHLIKYGTVSSLGFHKRFFKRLASTVALC